MTGTVTLAGVLVDFAECALERMEELAYHSEISDEWAIHRYKVLISALKTGNNLKSKSVQQDILQLVMANLEMDVYDT